MSSLVKFQTIGHPNQSRKAQTRQNIELSLSLNSNFNEVTGDHIVRNETSDTKSKSPPTPLKALHDVAKEAKETDGPRSHTATLVDENPSFILPRTAYAFKSPKVINLFEQRLTERTAEGEGDEPRNKTALPEGRRHENQSLQPLQENTTQGNT
eukprot:CAMPEP_0170511676 /NCGR_PEP_ID=MMETSP0208-20121228/66434_1 /TAXON_ID=197538 /ORGANISM="Strombidium inclinatum, Strain S3" /LENGTH=153 /DNA_ID=CAMNT_0010795237 /DNA_START=2023 /DNA_END=2484 /DNA_ORIENTATION=-